MTTQAMTPPPSFGRPHRQAGTIRPLTGNEFTAVATVAALVAVLGLLGFVNSFAAVADAARPSFGIMAWTVPLGIDLGIAIFAALDIVLARLDMRIRWLRLIPWTLTAATVYLNVADEATAFGKVAHAVLPCLWVVAVEVGSHVVRIRAGIESGTRMDRIRTSRWLLAPTRTVTLWRRMALWEIRSYPDALARERDRLLALTDLQDEYGVIAWRWKAPRKIRALYRLGELAPVNETAPLMTPDEEPPAIKAPSQTADKTPRKRSAARSRTGSRTKTGRKSRAVPDVDDLMPLGWRIAADLDSRRQPLNRDTLAAALRDAEQGVSNERVGALLARLKTEAPNHPTDPTTTDTAVVIAEGDENR